MKQLIYVDLGTALAVYLFFFLLLLLYLQFTTIVEIRNSTNYSKRINEVFVYVCVNEYQANAILVITVEILTNGKNPAITFTINNKDNNPSRKKFFALVFFFSWCVNFLLFLQLTLIQQCNPFYQGSCIVTFSQYI